MKKLTAFCLSLALLFGAAAPSARAKGLDLDTEIVVAGFDPGRDYAAAIQEALKDGGPYALQVGAIYERQRNLKIDTLNLPREKTRYFSDYDSAEAILSAMARDEEAKQAAAAPSYTPEELDLLSRIIYAEVGCTWIPDWVQQMTGSVVLNRVNSSLYPNTIREVIYQPGQYGPVTDGSIHKTPDARTVANARYLLEHGSICPANVIGQNSVVTGSGVYRSYTDPVLGATVYFCYL